MSAFKPVVSLVLIIGTLLFVVFTKMEERRLGYEILKLNRDQRAAVEERRQKELALARVSRPQHVEKFAQDHLTLKKLQDSQIIQLSGTGPSTSDKKGL